MNNFIYENKTKVYFGKGGVKEYLEFLLGHYGSTVMLAYGGGSVRRNGVYDEVTGILRAAGKTVVEFPGIMLNPTYAKVQEGARLARDHHVDLILGVGGGSVSDCCEVVSAQAMLDEDLWDMEMTRHTYPSRFIPLGVIVTAFGTGSEMNAGAVITHEEKRIKTGIFGAQADFAFLDPTYSMSVPFVQVIFGAFDTLSHAMETYFGRPEENNLSDDINEAVMRSVIRSICVLMKEPQSYEARSELAWASAVAENGMLKIGKVTDFQCHHRICRDNVQRFARFAQRVWDIAPRATEEETVQAGVEALAAFIREVGLPTTLTELGIPEDTDLRAVAESCRISTGCCKQLTHEEIYGILLACR